MLKHICGQCQKSFTSEQAYLLHAPVHSPIPAPAPKAKLTEKALLSAVRLARRARRNHGRL